MHTLLLWFIQKNNRCTHFCNGFSRRIVEQTVLQSNYHKGLDVWKWVHKGLHRWMHVKILKDYTQIVDLVTHSCFYNWADAEKTEDGRKRALAMKGIPTNEFQPVIYVSMQGLLSTHFTVGIQPPLSQRFGKMATPYFWVHYKCISTCFQESEDKNNHLCKMLSWAVTQFNSKILSKSATPKSLI